MESEVRLGDLAGWGIFPCFIASILSICFDTLYNTNSFIWFFGFAFIITISLMIYLIPKIKEKENGI